MLWKFGTNAEFGWERLDGNLTLSQTLFYAKTKSIYKLLHTEMDWNGMRARVIELARVCERERDSLANKFSPYYWLRNLFPSFTLNTI